MQRIVDGILFEGKHVADWWDVRTWRRNGVLERSARQVVEWSEVGPVPDLDKPDPERDAEWLAERHLQALKKAAQRAKQMCRRVIIAEGFNELLTLTYRDNQEDRELCKRHFKEWVRRMKRALGGTFRYCASFERQKRGAMHVHIACHKLPVHAERKGVKIQGWRLGTDVWHGIVGEDNGLCYVGGRTKWGKGRRKQMSLAKMASYVSKYILKDYEDTPEESNRYSRSNGTEIGEVHTMRLRCSFLDLLVVTFEQGEGDVLVSHRVGYFKDSMWLCTEERRESR